MPPQALSRRLGYALGRDCQIDMDADSKPWREVLPFKNEELPGVFLAGARYREGMTQAPLAGVTGIPRRHISEMENGRRPIGKKNARLLADALRIDPRRLLSV